MKKSKMSDIQKANYEYMRSLGIKKSWAKRFVEEGSDISKEERDKGSITEVVCGFAYWRETGEGEDFWIRISHNPEEWLTTKSYRQALLELPNNLVKEAE
jgi:hypothetical protein